MQADNIPLGQSHAHDEMLHLGAHVVDDAADVAQVLEDDVGRFFGYRISNLASRLLTARKNNKGTTTSRWT